MREARANSFPTWRRWLVWPVVGALSIGLVVMAPEPESGASARTPPAPASASTIPFRVDAAAMPLPDAHTHDPDSLALTSRGSSPHTRFPGASSAADRIDVFAPRSWSPPAPPAPPAPAPSAPPLPFTFVGKQWLDGEWELFLARGEQTFLARRGTVLEQVWRVEQATPPAASIIYLPLMQAQALNIGEAR